MSEKKSPSRQRILACRGACHSSVTQMHPRRHCFWPQTHQTKKKSFQKHTSDNNMHMTLEQTKGLRWPVVSESIRGYYTVIGAGGWGWWWGVKSWFTDLIDSRDRSRPLSSNNAVFTGLSTNYVWLRLDLFPSPFPSFFMLKSRSMPSWASQNQCLFSVAVSLITSGLTDLNGGFQVIVFKRPKFKWSTYARLRCKVRWRSFIYKAFLELHCKTV